MPLLAFCCPDAPVPSRPPVFRGARLIEYVCRTNLRTHTLTQKQRAEHYMRVIHMSAASGSGGLEESSCPNRNHNHPRNGSTNPRTACFALSVSELKQ